jgi:hypothetical protein
VAASVYRSEQDRQCTHAVILRRVHEITVAEESNQNYIFMCVCVSACVCLCVFVGACGWVGECWCTTACVCLLTYPVSNAQAPYCLRPLASPNFSTLPHNGTIFGKIFTEYKMRVLYFATTFIRNKSNSKKESARYCHKYENVFM